MTLLLSLMSIICIIMIAHMDWIGLGRIKKIGPMSNSEIGPLG